MSGGLPEGMNEVAGMSLVSMPGEEFPSGHEMAVVRGRESRVPV